ncbi:MAG: hypothetical protein PHQ36_08665 [Anaerolineales bacterium]|nr:hypothetical protein [Anaerolineales bacterium]
MSLPENPIIPTDDPAPKAPLAAQRARRRRAARQQMFPADAEGQAALVSALARRAYPSLELFVFSLVCGAIVGLGFLLDSQAVLILGILVAPLMTPWVGFLLAIITGSPRFLFETVMALLISGAIVFLGGLLTGFAARLFLPITLANVFVHAHLWIPELAGLSIGAITLVASFARSEDKPILPSILIAYAFYLPINAGGFGLGSGLEGVWPQGLLVFAVHFSLASVLGILTLFALKLRPTAAGIVMSGISLLILIGALIILMGGGVPAVPQPAATATPTILIPSPIPSATPSLTFTPTRTPRPTNTPTLAPLVTSTATLATATTLTAASTQTKTVGATKTLSATTTTASAPTTTETVPPSATPTATLTPQPVFGSIKANEGGGANLRQTPNGKFITTLDNGVAVEIQPDSRAVNGIQWLHVFVVVQGQRMEGWLLASVVVYDNPAQGVTPAP